MQSMVISITCQSQSMAPKRRRQISTPVIGPEAWLSTMSKGGCPPHQHPYFTRCHIRRSAFYHRSRNPTVPRTNRTKQYRRTAHTVHELTLYYCSSVQMLSRPRRRSRLEGIVPLDLSSELLVPDGQRRDLADSRESFEPIVSTCC